MVSAKDFLEKYINRDKKIDELKAEISKLRHVDKDAMNKDLHELIPGLPDEYVLIRKRAKTSGGSGKGRIKPPKK